MVLDPNFLVAGITYLQEHSDVAAVGGHVVEQNTGGEDLRVRAKAWRREHHRRRVSSTG